MASPFQSTAALFAPENLLPLSDIVLSAGVQAQLNTMTQEDVINFKKLVQQHYIATCEHVFNKTPINKDLPGHILMNFRFLKPSELKNHKERNVKDILRILPKLPLSIPSEIVVDELKILQYEIDDIDIDKLSMMKYWKGVMQTKTGSGSLKFPYISRVVRVCLILYHGNSDIERSLSNSGNLLSVNQTHMSVEILNAKMNVKNIVRKYNNEIAKIPISTELIKMCRNAHSLYTTHLEEARKEEEKMKLLSEAEKQEKEKVARKKEDLRQNREKLADLKAELENKQQQLSGKRKAYDETLNIGNKRLKLALEKNKLEDAQVAQAIIEGAVCIKKDIDTLIKESSSMESRINKIKDEIINGI